MSNRVLWRGGYGRQLNCPMQKLDPAFLFEIGDSVRAIKRVNASIEALDAYFALSGGKNAVTVATYQSVYAAFFHNPLWQATSGLVGCIDKLLAHITPEGQDLRQITQWQAIELQNLYSKFETIFISELQSLAVYMVTRKGGFDVDCMVDAGKVFFSDALVAKVPDAIFDVEQAMRCIAFEVPTAAGFHLHRAHESVLRIYWDSVTNGKKRPKENNMGVYIRELDAADAGRKSVRDHLRSIKDFHRNPLMHPEESLNTIDEAIDLMAAIRCSIGYMLAEIPGPANVVPLSPPTASE